MNLRINLNFAFRLPPSAFPLAVCFCGTILTVTRTGRYPASLTFQEPGLSSDQVWPNPQPQHQLFPTNYTIAGGSPSTRAVISLT